MTLRVPSLPPRLVDTRVALVGPTPVRSFTNTARIGTPPAGESQWMDVARAENWLLGGGPMQLGWWGPTAILGGATGVFHTYAWPRPQCFSRLWTFVMIGANVTGAVATADRPSGVPFETSTLNEIQVIRITEEVTDTTPTGEAISVSMAINANVAAAIILSASCIELPLPRVAKSGDSTGVGVHETTLRKWHPIAELDESSPSATEQRSATGAYRTSIAVGLGQHALRRAKIFDWHLTTGVSLSSSTFTNLFRVQPSGQTRYLTEGEVSRDTRWAVYAAASASAGQVRITSSVTGGTSTINVNSAVPAWYSADIPVACDDLDEDGWVRGSRETLTVARRATSGNIVVYGVCVGER